MKTGSAMRSARRLGAAIAVALVAVAVPAAADAPLELTWDMLAPARETAEPMSLEDRLAALGRDDLAPKAQLGGVVEHGETWGGGWSDADEMAARGSELVEALLGKEVRLPGYAVPLDLEEGGSRAFLLVPFVGACIHVPPPPPNQLVLVEADTPFPFEGLFDPVYVTGRLAATDTDLDLAEVGYQLSATGVEAIPFDEVFSVGPEPDPNE